MLEDIKSPDEISKYIARAKDKKDSYRLMGFGHRIYKNYDPRATIIRDMCHKLLKEANAENRPMFETALELERIALSDDYFTERKLYPNVDFYSGIILSAIGIPLNMFTVIFAMARSVGLPNGWRLWKIQNNVSVDRGRFIRVISKGIIQKLNNQN